MSSFCNIMSSWKILLQDIEMNRVLKKGDLLRVYSVDFEKAELVLVYIDHTCLRPDEIGEHEKEGRPRRLSKYGIKGVPRPAQFVPRDKEMKK